MSRRPFEFDNRVKAASRLRQEGLCAHCGESLDDLWEHAHHVVPNQSGDEGNTLHAWLRTEINCVTLCQDCHERVHQDGRFRDGAVAPAEYFPHSHGLNRASHTAWVQDLRSKAIQTVWGARTDWRV